MVVKCCISVLPVTDRAVEISGAFASNNGHRASRTNSRKFS
nr:MAG TPA: hypothetical protein [Caudoviricetes sp.]